MQLQKLLILQRRSRPHFVSDYNTSLRLTCKSVYVCVHMYSQFQDQRTLILNRNWFFCMHVLCRWVCAWNGGHSMPLEGIPFSWGCTFSGVYVPCISSHARWSYHCRFGSAVVSLCVKYYESINSLRLLIKKSGKHGLKNGWVLVRGA